MASKKSTRSSRGRSDFAKTMKRSTATQKRIRRQGSVEEAPAKKEMHLGVQGLIIGAVMGFFIGRIYPMGTGYANLYIGALIGGILGGATGCVADLIKRKGAEYRSNKEEKEKADKNRHSNIKSNNKY